jgi:hypothetical protein
MTLSEYDMFTAFKHHGQTMVLFSAEITCKSKTPVTTSSLGKVVKIL